MTGIAPIDSGKPCVVVVIPAYNAAVTLEKTYADIPEGCVDRVILVDDCSADDTVSVARRLGVTVIRHDRNRGYGANQKTCYRAALEYGADFVVMIHPDYQYDCRVIPYTIGFLKANICDIVLGSRIRSRTEALAGGMPLYKYIVNRITTFCGNVLLGQNLGDFHSGFRAYRRAVLETIPFEHNDNDFSFDSQLLVQAVRFGFRIGDVPVPTRYTAESSSIGPLQGVVYLLKTALVLVKYWIDVCRIYRCKIFFRLKS